MAGGIIQYSYVYNPLNWTDPLGLKVLYRSMSLDEYSDLIKTGKWSTNGQMEGKWFAESLDDAVTWGNKMGHGGESFRIVQVTVSDRVFTRMYSNPHLDDIGPARYAQVSDLNEYSTITWSKKFQYTC